MEINIGDRFNKDFSLEGKFLLIITRCSDTTIFYKGSSQKNGSYIKGALPITDFLKKVNKKTIGGIFFKDS